MASALLCIESSGNLCSIAFSGFASDVFLSSEPNQKHTEVILGMIRRGAEAAGGSLNQLKAVCFGEGPGAFTGLRVACGLAQGLGWALNLPLIPVNTLTALAGRHLETLSEGSRLLVATDARMHECYFAVYRVEDERLCEVVPASLAKPSDLLAAADDNGADLLCGNAFRVYAEEIGDIEGRKILSTEDVNAKMLEPLAQEYFAQNKTVKPERASPLYVRNRVALTIEERKAGQTL